MEITGTKIIFYLIAAVLLVSSVMAVTTRKMMRAATYLLFVLIGTAGIYLLLNYHFLAAVQLSVYAGGILILFIFAILLTNVKGERSESYGLKRISLGLASALAGVAVTFFVVFKYKALYSGNTTIMGDREINMKEIGTALMGTEKFQYILPFELLSILLLASIIGGILIARKR